MIISMEAFLALALALFASSALSANLGAPLVSCSEVDCPTTTNTTVSDCHVGDKTLSAIGVTDFNVSLANNSDLALTWTQGLTAYDDVDPTIDSDRLYEKTFYLGSPQGFDLAAKNGTSPSDFQACALFFTEVSDRVRFDGDNVPISVGTCADALNTECVDAVVARARELAGSLGRNASADACERLRSEFANNLAPQCAQFANGDRWRGLEVRDLTGPNAPRPITGPQNASSNCQPTLPKTNQLTPVAAFNTSGSVIVNDTTLDTVYGITPILTVFFASGDLPPAQASRLSPQSPQAQPQAQLSCLKVVDRTDASDATRDDGARTDGERPGNAAGLVMVPGAVMALGVAVALSVVLTL